MLKEVRSRGLKKCDSTIYLHMNNRGIKTLKEKTHVSIMDMKKRDLDKLRGKRDLKKFVEKTFVWIKDMKERDLKKPEIAIVNDGNGKVTQPRKPARRNPPRDPKTRRFVKVHPDRPKPPEQPALQRMRDAKERFISR